MQHLGANFVTLLADQLNQVGEFDVMPARDGHVLRHGQVIVAPVTEQITINPIGAIKLKPLDFDSPYTPCIDKVVSDMAARYKSRAGAIIFSGMCDDGKHGCQVMKQYNGHIWHKMPIVVSSVVCLIVSAKPESSVTRRDLNNWPII